MPYELLQAASPKEMVSLLNGEIRGTAIESAKDFGSSVEYVPGISGLTLVFTTPSVTVTFATANPAPLADIVTEINTQVQAVDSNFTARLEITRDTGPGDVRLPKKRLVLTTTTAAGLVLSATGTAMSALGLSATTVAPVNQTRIVFGGDTISGGLYIILTP